MIFMASSVFNYSSNDFAHQRKFFELLDTVNPQ